MTKFSELGLAEPVLKALAEEGYETPTPIQAQAIPVLLKGADLLGIAQTGTGKTAAFALPLLTRIAADKRPAPRRGARVLVLSPTRELAAQIGESFRTYGRHLGTSVAVVFGGVAHKPQINAMSKGVDVLVATPGRLIDHLETGVVTLEGVEALVLDEADQMLDLGFVRPIRRIVSKLRARRQNLFFSATMPHEIAALAAELLHEPVRVQVTPVATTAERVSQRVIHIEANKKRSLLVDLFGDPSMSRTLVFTRTKRGADRVARHLETAGIAAVAIHGNKSQRQREVALDAFRKAKTGVLVATDIAARGIDIDAVTHVVNFELPEVPEAYVHRIGRTARAGAEGQAISLCDGAERDLLRAIERLTRQQIPAEDRRNDASIAVDATMRSASGDRPQRSEGTRGRPARTGRPDRAQHRDRPERSDRALASDHAERRGRPERPERAPHADRPAHASRAERSARPEHTERRERFERKDRRDDARGEARRADTRHPHGERSAERRRDDRPREGGSRPWTNEPRARRADTTNTGESPYRAKPKPHRGQHGSDALDTDRKPHRRDESTSRSRHPDGSAVAHVFAAIDGRQGAGKQRHGQPGRAHGRNGAGKPHGSGNHGSGDHGSGKPGRNESAGGNGNGAGRPQRHEGGPRRRRNAGPARRLETV